MLRLLEGVFGRLLAELAGGWKYLAGKAGRQMVGVALLVVTVGFMQIVAWVTVALVLNLGRMACR